METKENLNVSAQRNGLQMQAKRLQSSSQYKFRMTTKQIKH